MSALALFGILMAPLPWHLILGVFFVVALFALLMDAIKLPLTRTFKVE